MRAEGARKKLALFKCISEGFIRKYAPKARKNFWVQKDGNDKLGQKNEDENSAIFNLKGGVINYKWTVRELTN